MHRHLRFSYESASLKLIIWDEKNATLGNLFSIHRGRGHANALMREVMEYADIHGLTLLLEVQQFQYADSMSPDNEGLKKFYAKFGFEAYDDTGMIRKPREIHAS